MVSIKLIDFILHEYFAIVEHIRNTIPQTENHIILDSHLFYAFLDKNLYIKRNQKLEIYKQLNFIHCNSKGYTSVMYDKNTKKSTRKIILVLDTYELLKKMYKTEIVL